MVSACCNHLWEDLSVGRFHLMLLGHPVKASIIQRKYLNIWVTYVYTVSKEFVILVALTYSLKQKPHFNK